MRLSHPATIASVSLLNRAQWKKYAIGAVFVVLYAISLQMWVTTAGQPYDWALEEQKRLIREKVNQGSKEKEILVIFNAGSAAGTSLGLNMSKCRVSQVKKASQADREGVKVGWTIKRVDGNSCVPDGTPFPYLADAELSETPVEVKFVKPVTGVSVEKGQQAKVDTELDIDHESLPSTMLPSALSCLLIFFTVTFHILFHLMCHWSIGFTATFLYQPARVLPIGVDSDEPTFIRVTPHDNKGKADICRLYFSDVTDSLSFTFQYQSFEYVEADEASKLDLVGDGEDGGIRCIQSPTNLTWQQYQRAKGLTSNSAIEKAQDKFGTNTFELPRPTFQQLFKEQLMSPLAIFQFFCMVLWAADSMWRYTGFTLLSILGFEASTAFQRLKSMATLRGMSTKSYNVHVYRESKWQEKPIDEILPGDVLSLSATRKGENDAKEGEGDENKESKESKDNSNLIVPCDCVILKGSAIVNEATLTGESVPQMKDSLGVASDPNAQVDFWSKHRIHTLFSGTSLIQATPAQRSLEDGASNGSNGETVVPDPPNDGIVCFVLRTGFNSSQGELMRMIEFSTQEVGADKWETAAQLLFLLCFALAASGYVLHEGLKDPTRPTYKTILRCILIITQVVPPHLPMQMAFAVHTALMSLLKAGIFCTEPFRVPYAGKIKKCFFDKTGTLTSDSMVAAGIVNSDSHDKKAHKDNDVPKPMIPMKDASTFAAMCIAGCHSLIEVEGKAIGDPIEVAALSGVAWSYIPKESTATPGPWHSKEMFLEKQKEYVKCLRDDIEADKKEKEQVTKNMEDLAKEIKQDKQDAKKLRCVIAHRFHFSSELQRMSTLCHVHTSGGEKTPEGTYCLTKGSPEAIAKLLCEKPEWYDRTYQALAESGLRVLALGYRHLDSGMGGQYSQQPREDIEKDLQFAGFASFRCETRKDTRLVIQALQDSAHDCVMLTGDAPLTALSVAREVGIAKLDPSKALVLTGTGDHGLEWVTSLTTKASSIERIPFQADGVRELSKKYDLVITGKELETAFARADVEALKAQLGSVSIYARLSPQQKEQVILAVKTFEKVTTYMCGDGGNDVGALKEADVGLALLSGFGNSNVDKSKEDKDGSDEIADAESALQEQRKENAQKAQQMSKRANDELARKRKDLMSKQQEWIQEEMEKRRQRGEDTGVMAQMQAMGSVMSRLKQEMAEEQKAIQKRHGNSFAAGAAKWAGDVEDMDTPMVQLGDASTAAPFTSRAPSIGSTVDIIRQGRCTLLSAVQQMQIMMLESMISAYTMSTMSIDGTRSSEAQMMASGVLMTVASIAFSFARPVDRMHKVRPISSVFHKSAFFSIIGQLVIHLCCMVYIARLAKEIMGEEAVKEVIEFEKRRDKKIESMSEEELSDTWWFMSVPFKTNLLNTCCWLVSTSQSIAVILVNYKGRPWMKGVLENQPLFLSLFLCTALVAVCAWGVFPYLNEILNLVVVPEDLRPIVMTVLFVSLVGTFLWDRLMTMIFAPEIFRAIVDEARATTLKDFMPLLTTVGYVAGGLLLLGSGNILMVGAAFMIYRHYRSQQPQPAAA